MKTMKLFPLFVLALFAFHSGIAQENENHWIQNIDRSSFKVHKGINKLSKDFLSVMEFDKREIASKNEEFSKGCTGRGKHKKLNWIAISRNHQQIISMSFGGFAYQTRYFLLDTENKELNVRALRITSSKQELTFEEFVQAINKGQYERDEYWEP